MLSERILPVVKCSNCYAVKLQMAAFSMLLVTSERGRAASLVFTILCSSVLSDIGNVKIFTAFIRPIEAVTLRIFEKKLIALDISGSTILTYTCDGRRCKCR